MCMQRLAPPPFAVLCTCYGSQGGPGLIGSWLELSCATRKKMAPLRWGIYSAGKISHDFVVGVKTLPETEHQVVAVASRSAEDAAEFAKTHSIPRHYGSYAQLAADAQVRSSFLLLSLNAPSTIKREPCGPAMPYHLCTYWACFDLQDSLCTCGH